MFKRHYIDEIEYPSSPICGEKPQFESNVTSFQFHQNASAFCGKKLGMLIKYSKSNIFYQVFSIEKKILLGIGWRKEEKALRQMHWMYSKKM